MLHPNPGGRRKNTNLGEMDERSFFVDYSSVVCGGNAIGLWVDNATPRNRYNCIVRESNSVRILVKIPILYNNQSILPSRHIRESEIDLSP